MNKIESYEKDLTHKGIAQTNEGMLIVKRYEYYLQQLNEGNGSCIYNIHAFYNVINQMDAIVSNTLTGKNAFSGITGLFEQAYISEVDEKLDSFVIFLPLDFSPQNEYPLIFFLHGYGEWVYLPYNSTAHNALLQTCNRHKVILAAPSGKHIPETGVPSYEFGEQDILQVLKLVMNSYKINPCKVYLTGVSMGGHGTWYIGSRHNKMFSAIAPVCGFGKGEFSSPLIDIQGLSGLPAFAFHGETDTIVSVTSSRIMVEEMKKNGFDISYKEFKNVGHDCWDYAYSDDFLVEWLLKH